MPKTFRKPAYFYLNPGAAPSGDDPGEIVIPPSNQVGGATISFSEMTEDNFTQASKAPADTVIMGAMFESVIQIADISDLDLYNFLFTGSTSVGADAARYVGLAERVGASVRKFPVLVKLADVDGPTTNKALWFYAPVAAIFTNDTQLQADLDQQMSLQATIRAFSPEEDSPVFPYKVVRGDYTVLTAATPTPTPTP